MGTTSAELGAADRRWCFADQLGPHFLDHHDQPVLLIESRGVFERRRFHRRKAHLVLSALRHRAAELGDQCTFLQTRTYRQALDRVTGKISVCRPTSWAADRFVRSIPGVRVVPERGFCTGRTEFDEWARRQRTLRLENFYRDARRRLDLLMDGDQPGERVGARACPFTGGYWWFLSRNREYLGGNRRMSRPLAGLGRLADVDEVVEQQRRLGTSAP